MEVSSIGQSGLNMASMAPVANVSNQDAATRRAQQEEVTAKSSEATQVRATEVRQGAANVDQSEEYIDQARQLEAYDSNSRVVEGQNQMVGKAINLTA